MTGRSKNFLIALLVFLIVTVAVLIVLNVLFTVIPIKGDSMTPTILDGDRALVLKVGGVARGDVVVFYNSDKDSEHSKLVKRVIALPGDTVETRTVDGKPAFFVNGAPVEDGYAGGSNVLDQPKLTVPEDSFYYLGDNRTVSLDSRYGKWGKLGDVIGRVVLRFNASTFFDVSVVASAGNN